MVLYGVIESGNKHTLPCLLVNIELGLLDSTCSRRQNRLGHFTLNWAFLRWGTVQCLNNFVDDCGYRTDSSVQWRQSELVSCLFEYFY